MNRVDTLRRLMDQGELSQEGIEETMGGDVEKSRDAVEFLIAAKELRRFPDGLLRQTKLGKATLMAQQVLAQRASTQQAVAA